mmetsp:Transcript_28209/g.44388  ORF Transcript_28209/g.44388 Transcript_28209/m.44388 type:complete len:260 (+) Transcript_28209:71-850(+)
MDPRSACTILEADIVELKTLITDKMRPSNRERLKGMVAQLESELATKRSSLPPEEDKPEAGVEDGAASPPAPPASSAQPKKVFTSIDSFSWDQGEYNTPWVTIYLFLDGVGAVKDNVTSNFTASSFDVTITDLNGKNYRLIKENLDKEIIPAESKHIVKANKIIIKLKKVKGEYSYDHWTGLTAKRAKTGGAAGATKEDPMGGLMSMMKDMYEDGDDNMKKVIGEAMEKSMRGEKSDPTSSFGGDSSFGEDDDDMMPKF